MQPYGKFKYLKRSLTKEIVLLGWLSLSDKQDLIDYVRESTESENQLTKSLFEKINAVYNSLKLNKIKSFLNDIRDLENTEKAKIIELIEKAQVDHIVVMDKINFILNLITSTLDKSFYFRNDGENLRIAFESASV